MSLTDKEIEYLMKSGEGKTAYKNFLSGLKLTASTTLNKMGKELVSSVPSFVGSSSKVVAAGFRLAGATKAESKFAGAMTKVSILSITLGPIGAVIGAPNLIFSVLAIIDESEREAQEKRTREIIESMQEKMSRITYNTEKKLLEIENREIATDQDAVDAKFIALWFEGNPITRANLDSLIIYYSELLKENGKPENHEIETIRKMNDIEKAALYIQIEKEIYLFNTAGNEITKDKKSKEALLDRFTQSYKNVKNLTNENLSEGVSANQIKTSNYDKSSPFSKNPKKQDPNEQKDFFREDSKPFHVDSFGENFLHDRVDHVKGKL